MTIKTTPNYSAQTFTIRKQIKGKTIAKYRTIKYHQIEFDDMTLMTQSDWDFFLKNLSCEYYMIS